MPKSDKLSEKIIMSHKKMFLKQSLKKEVNLTRDYLSRKIYIKMYEIFVFMQYTKVSFEKVSSHDTNNFVGNVNDFNNLIFL